MTPGKSQRQQGEELLQAVFLRHGRVFQLEAARFQGRKQRFNDWVKACGS